MAIVRPAPLRPGRCFLDKPAAVVTLRESARTRTMTPATEIVRPKLASLSSRGKRRGWPPLRPHSDTAGERRCPPTSASRWYLRYVVLRTQSSQYPSSPSLQGCSFPHSALEWDGPHIGALSSPARHWTIGSAVLTGVAEYAASQNPSLSASTSVKTKVESMQMTYDFMCLLPHPPLLRCLAGRLAAAPRRILQQRHAIFSAQTYYFFGSAFRGCQPK